MAKKKKKNNGNSKNSNGNSNANSNNTTSQPSFGTLEDVAQHLRNTVNKNALIYAHNGTGKTRLSVAFKNIGKTGNGGDTLYFNAFTEDLFYWFNDFDNDIQRELRFHKDSHFFDGLKELEMSNRIRPLLSRYADFDFELDHDKGVVVFSRQVVINSKIEKIENIKISRGEENIFIWCFFLAVAELAIDKQDAYKWVNYIYIDDPISSLDDNNAIAVAGHLTQLLKREDNDIKTIISTHHGLFFNVMHNELGGKSKYYLDKTNNSFLLKDTKDTPFFHHVSLIKKLYEVAENGTLYTYHFSILRNVLEKTAAFHGFNKFDACIKKDETDAEGIIHTRIINILNHGNYSLFDPVEMQDENKEYFKKILKDFMDTYKFNPELFQKPIIGVQ